MNFIPSWLKDAPIGFEISRPEECIHTLLEPCEFFQAIMDEVGASKERIYLSSLYLGNGQLESSLVDKVGKHLCHNKQVVFRSLFDYCRGLRGDLSVNTAGQLLPLRKAHPSRVAIYLFRSPFFRGLRRVIPQRYNEVFSVHHMKLYVFDSTVILSGANLSHDYFTNRQDRYVVFKNCPALANFCCDLMDTLGELSFSVNENGDIMPPGPDTLNAPNSAELQEKGNLALHSLIRRYSSQYGANKMGNTMIFPFIQSAALNIYDEQHLTEKMLNEVEDDSLVISTSYFNLTPSYQDILLRKCQAKAIEIHVSSPRTNGFYKGSGPSQFIPHGYIHFAKLFYDQLCLNNRQRQMKLFEYEKDNWTFHTKGIWLSKGSQPYASFIGSTNFSYRSVYRDQEAQFVLVTSNQKVRARLQREVTHLRKRASPLTKAVFARSDHAIARWVPLVTKVAYYFF